MFRQLRTAVAAAAQDLSRRQICRALAECGLELAAMAQEADPVPALLAEHRSDLLIADMQLPQLEGDALARRMVWSKSLPVRPAAIVLCGRQENPFRREESERMGILYAQKPLTGAVLGAAIARLTASPPVFPDGEIRLADRLMDALGMPDHIGTACLKSAALICAGDERRRSGRMRDLYPMTARMHHISAMQAERAMRHAIELAWQSSKIENQYRIFADTVDAGRGQPTCGEMISRLADILRLEG